MEGKASSGGEHAEDKEENFLKKAAHSIRDKLHVRRRKKPNEEKSKSAAAGKTDSSSAATDEDDERDARPNPKPTTPEKAEEAKPAKANTDDKVHLSFYGVSTVDDLLDRIDEVVKSANIKIEGDTGNTAFAIQGAPPTPRSSKPDRETEPSEKPKEEAEPKAEGDEPIRIDYNEMHTIQDLLKAIHKQPGSRQVVLENAPDDPNSAAAQQNAKAASPAPKNGDESHETPSGDHEGPPVPPKSILKTSQDPSSLDTSTKVASLKDDQIHVNIEGVRCMDDLLTRIDEAVQRAPLVIETKPPAQKRTVVIQAPKPADDDEPAPTTASNENAPVATNKEENASPAEQPARSSDASGGVAKTDWI